jgi:hypothetical protein
LTISCARAIPTGKAPSFFRVPFARTHFFQALIRCSLRFFLPENVQKLHKRKELKASGLAHKNCRKKKGIGILCHN